MEPIQIRPFDKPLDIRLTDQKVELPPILSEKVQEYWGRLLQEKPNLRNGEVFTVLDVKEDSKAIRIRLAETDYAHYLYSREVGELGGFTVRLIHPAALVLADGKMVFGSMGAHTSLAGTIQCCGGGLDREAVGRDGVVAIERTMAAELQEELGINMHDSGVVESALPTYLKFGGPTGKMVLVYVVKLKQSSEQFLQDYASFVERLSAKHEEPEFEKLLCIDNRPAAVEAFIQENDAKLNEYMPILLRTAASEAA